MNVPIMFFGELVQIGLGFLLIQWGRRNVKKADQKSREKKGAWKNAARLQIILGLGWIITATIYILRSLFEYFVPSLK